jgi:DNA ligase (NAD+)
VLARHFITMDAIRAADTDALAAVPKLPGANAPKIAAHIAAMGEVIDKMTSAGVNMSEPVTEDAASGPLAGQVIVVTGGMNGALAGRNRNDVKELIENAGGTSSGSVSRKTTLLVAALSTGRCGGSVAEAGAHTSNPEPAWAVARGALPTGMRGCSPTALSECLERRAQ